jgi:hypothetical protein
MPSYGKDKIRDMSRSILPSKRRKTGKKSVRRKTRRNTTEILNEASAADNEDLDFQDRKVRIDTRQAVIDRQAADKVAPLIRWAKEVTHGKPDKRLAQLRSMLPSNTIGRHAVEHVIFEKEFKINPLAYKSRVDKKRSKEFDWALFAKDLLEIITYHHAEFNRAMSLSHRMHYESVPVTVVCPVTGKVKNYSRAEPRGPKKARLLLGSHDIPDFIAALRHHVFASRWDYHPEWLYKAKEFVQEKLYARP